MEENKKKEFNFVFDDVTEQDKKYYYSLDIRGHYTGRQKVLVYDWVADRNNNVYLVGNEVPNLRDNEQSGYDYYNIIYQDKVGLIGYEIDYKRGQDWIYNVKEIILDKRLKNEEENVCEAIKQALIVQSEKGERCLIGEWPDEIIYK